MAMNSRANATTESNIIANIPTTATATMTVLPDSVLPVVGILLSEVLGCKEDDALEVKVLVGGEALVEEGGIGKGRILIEEGGIDEEEILVEEEGIGEREALSEVRIIEEAIGAEIDVVIDA